MGGWYARARARGACVPTVFRYTSVYYILCQVVLAITQTSTCWSHQCNEQNVAPLCEGFHLSNTITAASSFQVSTFVFMPNLSCPLNLI